MADLQAIADAVIGGDRDTVAELAQGAVDEGVDPEEIINEGLIAGMNVVGVKFKNNEFYVPEVLIAARAMHGGMDIVKPLLADSDVASRGKVVIGTVKGRLQRQGCHRHRQGRPARYRKEPGRDDAGRRRLRRGRSGG